MRKWEQGIQFQLNCFVEIAFSSAWEWDYKEIYVQTYTFTALTVVNLVVFDCRFAIDVASCGVAADTDWLAPSSHAPPTSASNGCVRYNLIMYRKYNFEE